MSVTGVNPYSTNAVRSTTGTTASNANLSMDDFFTLLSAQLQNQNMFNPMQDTEFIGQMAQFSTLQQMQQLSGAFMATMAVSFLGKYAKAQSVDDAGLTTETEGVVEKVDFTGGTPHLQINGQWFETGSVTEVQSQAPAAAETTGSSGSSEAATGTAAAGEE